MGFYDCTMHRGVRERDGITGHVLRKVRRCTNSKVVLADDLERERGKNKGGVTVWVATFASGMVQC